MRIEVRLETAASSVVMLPWAPGWVAFAELYTHCTTFINTIVLKSM